MKTTHRVIAAAVVLSLLAGCTLPRGAAMQNEITRNDSTEAPGFAHYDINSGLLPALRSWPAGNGVKAARGWPNGGQGGAGQILAAGDSVQLAIWENGENKLLTTPGAPSTPLPSTQISPMGSVFVPYIGAVKVSGLSPEAAREKIQDQIGTLIPDVQVQLAATPGKANSVDLIGGVANPGNVPLIDRSMTVLGLVSQGGGALPAIENPQLRLIRGGRVYEASLESVLDNPSRDIGLRPGDKLMVQKDSRSFLAFGAAGRQEIVPFPKERVSAMEAVTLAGGLMSSRADPKGVLILREYAPSAVRAQGAGGPENSRVVFTINLTTTDGLFSAQNFDVQPNDLVLATESPIVNTRTVLGLIGSVFGIVNTGQNATN